MRGPKWLSMVCICVLAACGGDDDGGNKPIDASGGSGSDGAIADAPPIEPDASGPPAVGPACGAVTCSGGDVCCLGAQSTCKPADQCPSQAFACDGAEDCNGGTCCYGNGGQGGSECQAGACAAPACHVDADCSGATPKCCPRLFTPGYKVCQPACV